MIPRTERNARRRAFARAYAALEVAHLALDVLRKLPKYGRWEEGAREWTLLDSALAAAAATEEAMAVEEARFVVFDREDDGE